MWHSVDGMGWWMALGSVWMVFFWGLVIWFIVRLTSRSPETSVTSAIEILKARYARGELTREQYHEMRRELEA
jgi:putative membrane protein